MAIARQIEELQIVPRQGLDQTVGSTTSSTSEKSPVSHTDPATKKQWENLGHLAIRYGTIVGTGLTFAGLFH